MTTQNVAVYALVEDREILVAHIPLVKAQLLAKMLEGNSIFSYDEAEARIEARVPVLRKLSPEELDARIKLVTEYLALG